MSRSAPIAVACAVLAFGVLGPSFVILALAHGRDASGADESQTPPSSAAAQEIPPLYLRLYESAARRYGLEWEVLAGIGKVECDHGQDPSPSCTHEGAVNSAGAGGPMQFLAATFLQFGVAPDGGRPDRWNPADAIFSAARYLVASGAPGDYSKAIFAYNHAWWYVAEVLTWARHYRGGGLSSRGLAAVRSSPSTSSTRVEYIRGSRARLDPTDGHVAMIPDDVPFAVQAMLIGRERAPGSPLRSGGAPGSAGCGCRGLLEFGQLRPLPSGHPPIERNRRGQSSGSGLCALGPSGARALGDDLRHDTPTPHVFMVIAGLRLDTRAGIDIGPNRYQDGPRWRIFPTIPAWAPWAVRHPAGL